jgi:hypothetical protein
MKSISAFAPRFSFLAGIRVDAPSKMARNGRWGMKDGRRR